MDVAQLVHRDAAPRFASGAADECRENEGRPGWIDFRNEHVEGEPGALDGIGQRKVARVGPARNLGIAGRVDRDRVGVVCASAAQVSGVDQRGSRWIEFGNEDIVHRVVASFASIGLTTGKSSEITIPVT